MKNKSQHLIDSVIPSVTSSSNDLSIMTLSPNATGGGDLNQPLQAQSLGLENWIDGVTQFLDGLINTLESQVVDGLPVLGDVDLSDTGFLKSLKEVFVSLSTIDTPQELLDSLNAQFTKLLPGALTTNISFGIDGHTFDASSSLWNKAFGELLQTSDNFVVNLNVAGSELKEIAANSLDLGLDSLGLGFKETTGIDLALDYDLNFGLGLSSSEGFYIQADDGQEINLGVGMGFDSDSQITMNLGELNFTMTDVTPGSIVTNSETSEDSALANRELNASFGIDLGDGIIASSQGDFLDGASVDGQLKADLNVDLTADLFSQAGLGASLNMGYYGVDGNPINFNYTLDGQGFTIDSGTFKFGITDTYINLGDLLSQPVLNLLKQAQQVFKPLQPVIDILMQEIPLISDISKKAGDGPVRTLDLLRLYGEGGESAK